MLRRRARWDEMWLDNASTMTVEDVTPRRRGRVGRVDELDLSDKLWIRVLTASEDSGMQLFFPRDESRG